MFLELLVISFYEINLNVRDDFKNEFSLITEEELCLIDRELFFLKKEERRGGGRDKGRRSREEQTSQSCILF